MPLSHHAAICGQGCDYSMGLEDTANFEYLVAFCHLPDNPDDSRQ